MPKLIAKVLPKALKDPIELFYNRLKWFGIKRYCPACKSWVKQFLPFGKKQRNDALCPICSLVERHRLAWLVLEDEFRKRVDSQNRILHFAPEPKLTKFFKSVNNSEYLSADLTKKSAMVNFDITQIPHGESSFDVIYCSHVLEHVPDDAKALSELRRVVSDNGIVIIIVPIHREITYEDFSIVDDDARAEAFGQYDHVRVYGDDFRDRLKTAGFDFKEYKPSDYLSDKQIIRYGLGCLNKRNQLIFACTKSSEKDNRG